MNRPMNWYHLIRGYETNGPFYVSSEGELEGHEWWDFDKGMPIEGWQSRAWIRSTSPNEDGPSDDGLVNHLALLIFSSRMRAALESSGITGIQYLPIRVLRSDETEYPGYSIANILNVAEALDKHRSKFTAFPEDYFAPQQRGQISGIQTEVLKANALHDLHILRLKEFPEGIYVSQYFLDIWEKNGFTGYSFDSVQLS